MAKTPETKTPPAAPPAPAAPPTSAAPESPASTPETTPPQIRRGPGRPRKDAPVSPSDAAAAGSAPKPARGRPKKGVTFSGDDVAAMAKQVQGLHQLAALATGIPELELQREEAEMLGVAIARVCEEYGLSLSGKTGALLQLAAAGAMIYAPRLSAVASRVKQQAQAKRAGLRVVEGGAHGGDTAPA